MAFAEDLSQFFADFGDDGTLDGAAVRVIFDAPAEPGLTGLGLARSTQCRIETADVPSRAEGLVLVVPQGSFSVREHLPDGTGLSVLTLAEFGT